MNRQDYLSKRNCDCLKGVFAVFVLLHHLYQHSGLFENSVIGAGLQYLGYYSVGIFFFLSGYGLAQSYRTKGRDYLYGFPRSRLLPFYAMMVFLTIVYAVYWIIMGENVAVFEIVQSFLFGGTIISNGWYLQVQLLCYVLFYSVVRFCREQSTGLCLIALAVAAYIGIMMIWDYPLTWYAGTPLFVIGLWFPMRKEKVDAYLSGGKMWSFALFASAALLLLMLLVFRSACAKLLQAACMTISECAFVLCVLLIVRIVPINYKPIRVLGDISLEIYVTQGLFLRFFHSGFLTIQNPYLYVAVVSVSTFIAAIVIHPIIKGIFLLFGGSRGGSK